jgi:hypothetical protein
MEYVDGICVEKWVEKSLIKKLVGFLIFAGGCSSNDVKGVELANFWFSESFEVVASLEVGL